MGGCKSKCRQAKARAEEAQRRIEDAQRALARQAEEGRRIQEQMQRTYESMVTAKGTHIADLKHQLEVMKRAKERVDQELRNLQNELLELGKMYSENALEAQRLFAAAMNEKDEQLRDIMKSTLAGFRQLISESDARNERQFNRMMEQMTRQDKRIAELLERMEKRLEQLEMNNELNGNDHDDEDSDDNFEPYVGVQLYQMVNDWRHELEMKHNSLFGINSSGVKSANFFVPSGINFSSTILIK